MSAGVILFRLLIATLLGGVIGAEREWRNQNAGLRTHLILSLGAALITIVSIDVSQQLGGDPTRIAANIVTGIGFLGAGAILRLGLSVRGLTTAASIWTTAGIGMAAGAGMYWAAFVTTGFVLLGLVILRKVEYHFESPKGNQNLFIATRNRPDTFHQVESRLREAEVTIRRMDLQNDPNYDRSEIRLVVKLPAGTNRSSLAEDLRNIENILEVEFQ